MEESCNLPKSLLHESLQPVSQSPQSSSAGVTTRTGKAQLRYISVTSTACQPSHLDGRRASSSPALTPQGRTCAEISPIPGKAEFPPKCLFASRWPEVSCSSTGATRSGVTLCHFTSSASREGPRGDGLSLVKLQQ